MVVEKWNILEDMNTAEDVVEFLLAACETPNDRDHIKSAIAIAMEAIKVYGIKMATDEEAASLAEDAAAIRSGKTITRDILIKRNDDGTMADVDSTSRAIA